jgi:hypothetical protein
MTSNLILDLLVAALLAATLFYSFRLERRLRAFRSGQDGLREVIERLDAATDNARAAIEAIKVAGSEAAEQLDKRVRGAQALVDELKVIVESGDNLAARLETRLTGAARATAHAVDPQETFASLQRVVPREERILRALREAR